VIGADTRADHALEPGPFSLGSYSCTPVGAKQSQRRQIGMPVENRVFFAGEATSQFLPSTVHGAFLPCVRAAREIRLADARRVS
jgi:monoamine oxidase